MVSVSKVVTGIVFLFLLSFFLPVMEIAINTALPFADEPTAVIIQLFPFVMVVLTLVWMARDDETVGYPQQ